MINPTVLTAGQEREQKGGFVLGSSWNGKGTHMWRLKQEKPELFERQEKAYGEYLADHHDDRPPGFETCSMKDWLYNKERNVFMDKATKQLFWFDEVGKVHRPLSEGEAQPVIFSGGAAAVPGTSASASSETDVQTKQSQQAPKHISINDLHLAAKALKMDLSHLDRPAGALALVGGANKGSAPSVAPPEAAARALPEKLLRRLAAFRGEWSDEMLGGAVASAFVDVAAGLGGHLPVAAVALVTGQRLVAVAAPGTCFSIATLQPDGTAEPVSGCAAAPSLGEPTASRSRKLADDATASFLVTLAVGDVSMEGIQSVEKVAPHLALCHPRAASIAMLKANRESGCRGPLAVACARLGPRVDVVSAQADPASSSSTAGHPAKRQKTSEDSSGKIRLRQVLLRHVGLARGAVDLRGKPVKRTLEEAEEQLLAVQEALIADGCSSFATVCKAISECQSALRGCEFAGDLGWLDRKSMDALKHKEKALRVHVPANVLRAAFELGVGELGDILTSEIGVHLIQRTA